MVTYRITICLGFQPGSIGCGNESVKFDLGWCRLSSEKGALTKSLRERIRVLAIEGSAEVESCNLSVAELGKAA